MKIPYLVHNVVEKKHLKLIEKEGRLGGLKTKHPHLAVHTTSSAHGVN
jgi:hypothetical protein